MKAHILGKPLKKDKLNSKDKKELKRVVNKYFGEKMNKWLYSDLDDLIDMPYEEIQ